MRGRIYKNKPSEIYDTDFKNAKELLFFNPNHIELNKVVSQPNLHSQQFMQNLNQHSEILNHYQEHLNVKNCANYGEDTA